MTTHLTSLAGAGRRLPVCTAFEDVLPNVSYRVDGAPVRLSDVVVRGRVVSAEEGRGWRPSEDERNRPDGEVGDFGDPEAWSRTLHLHVQVDEVLGGEASLPDEIRVGLAIGGDIDPEVVVRGLRALGPVVLPLTKSSPVFEYDRGLFGIAEDGALLADVLDDGRLELPFKPGASAQLLRSLPSLDALKAKAAAPRREVRISRNGEQGAAPTTTVVAGPSSGR